MKKIVEDIVECSLTRQAPASLTKMAESIGPHQFWVVCHKLTYGWWRRRHLSNVARSSRVMRVNMQHGWCKDLERFLTDCAELKEMLTLSETHCDFTDDDIREINEYSLKALPELQVRT